MWPAATPINTGRATQNRTSKPHKQHATQPPTNTTRTKHEANKTKQINQQTIKTNKTNNNTKQSNTEINMTRHETKQRWHKTKPNNTHKGHSSPPPPSKTYTVSIGSHLESDGVFFQ